MEGEAEARPYDMVPAMSHDDVSTFDKPFNRPSIQRRKTIEECK